MAKQMKKERKKKLYTWRWNLMPGDGWAGFNQCTAYTKKEALAIAEDRTTGPNKLTVDMNTFKCRTTEQAIKEWNDFTAHFYMMMD